MAITRRTSTIVQNASTTSLAGTLPTDLTTGDYCLMFVAASSTVATFSGTPSGWTQVFAPTQIGDIAAECVSVYGRFDPPSAPTMSTTSAASRWTIIMQAYGGVDTTTPQDVTPTTASQNSGSGATTTIGSVTTTLNDALLWSFIGQDTSSSTWTAPSGMTIEQQTSGGGGRSCAYAYEARPTAGATGTRAWTSSGTTATTGVLGALRPAAAVGETFGGWPRIHTVRHQYSFV